MVRRAGSAGGGKPEHVLLEPALRVPRGATERAVVGLRPLVSPLARTTGGLVQANEDPCRKRRGVPLGKGGQMYKPQSASCRTPKLVAQLFSSSRLVK